MGWLHQAKQSVKPVLVGLGRSRAIREGALRFVYLSKFHLWCQAHSCPELESPKALYQTALKTLPRDQPLNYLEFGVYRGNSIRWWVEHVQTPGSVFAGFDTFTGLPEDWSADKRRGTFSTDGVLPNIPDPRCQFVVGLFQDTLPAFMQTIDWTRPTVVHLDADLYSSTLFVLLTIVPKLKTGDLLIFDEFQDYLDEFRAFEDLCLAYPFRFALIGQNENYTRVAIMRT